MNKVLSVSVAAYNVEKFIEKNLDSFVNSEVREDIEVLVTDDGSKDTTPDIVSKYEAKYPGVVKLIKQKNAGPGSTVNSGIKNATGKYFRMVDGDDWVDTENLSEYINFLKSNDVDMIITNYTLVDNNTEEKVEKRIENKDTNVILEFSKQCNGLDIAMHNVTYKTEILKNNDICLDNGFYTDVEYLLLPIPFVKTIAFLDTNIYMYRVSLATQSMSMPSMQRNIAMHELVLKRLINYYEDIKKENKLDKDVLKYIAKRISDMAGTQLAILISFKPNKKYKKELKELFEHIKKTSSDIYLEYSKKRTVKVLNYSKFLLYSLISRVYRQKNGVE